ncbi:hypothetical protein [Mycobacterium sp. 1423905.2]|uniref:hypothetical protein n=1 Tax=Mycobacterium sp. 1423905.2 TaxID=1856859 RepID=UPI0007FF54E3|nr:hypothetical protein [Mycobacterium sp. 1423905.2]OBJ51704.1 hypothetical protein A9W95_21665 [Mycobacterium sp. 1423905.2]
MKPYALFTIFALYCAAFLAAAPLASAEVRPADGVFTYTDDNGVQATWTIRTTCAPQCVAQVTTGPGQSFSAPLVNGRHTVTRTVPQGVKCPLYAFADSLWGGGTYPATIDQSWSPQTLTGDVNYLQSSAPCSIADLHDSFTLSRIG